MGDSDAVDADDDGPAPVATPEDEAAFVQGLSTGEKHPDNESVFEEPELPEPDGEPEEHMSDEELAAAVAAVDPDDVDLVGHDESDLVIEPNTGATVPAELAEPGSPDGTPEADDIGPA